MNAQLRESFRFHLQHGGYSVPPGRAMCALQMVRAEQTARDLNLKVRWEEEDIEPDFDDERDNAAIRSGKLDWLFAYVPDPTTSERYAVLASLGGIAVRPNDPYRRVVEAELYAEAIGILQDRLAGV